MARFAVWLSTRAFPIPGLGMLVVGLLVALPAHPQVETPPLALALESHPEVPLGKIAGAVGTARTSLERYSLADLQITQPVLVALLPASGGGEAELQLFTDGWQAPRRTALTDHGAPAVLRLRTQGDLGIGVRAVGGAQMPYELFVWVSDELDDVVLPAPNVPAGAAEGGSRVVSGLHRSPLVLAVAGLLGLGFLALVVALLAVLLWRRSPRPAAGHALDRKTLALVVAVLATAAASSAASARIAAGKTLNDIVGHVQKWNSIVDSIPGLSKTLPRALNPKVPGGMKVLAPIAGGLVDLTEWYHSYPPLDPDDEGFDRRAAGLPTVPTSCAGEDCGRCPGDPYARLREARNRLERNRRIYEDFMKWAKKGLAVGDSIAGASGLGGLAWMNDRADIERSIEKVKTAYDTGYASNLEKVQAALQEIARCEAEVYRSPDWYNRYGFIYFETLQLAYRNPY